MVDFITIVENHGWDLEEVLEHKARASFFKLFENGFLMIVPEGPEGEFDLLYSASYNNVNSISMWREIKHIIAGRKRPIVTTFDHNYEMLIRVARPYGVVEYPENVVVFP